jgi:hypothetical protein
MAHQFASVLFSFSFLFGGSHSALHLPGNQLDLGPLHLGPRLHRDEGGTREFREILWTAKEKRCQEGVRRGEERVGQLKTK